MYIWYYTKKYIWQCLEIGVRRGPTILLQTFVAGPLSQTFVAGLCVEYCSLQQACRREGLSQDPPILLQALSQKGRPGLLQARWFFKGCHIYIHIYVYYSSSGSPVSVLALQGSKHGEGPRRSSRVLL